MGHIEYTPILFGYDISVFTRRCEWYLTLRGIPYARCIQPNRMPRPDLERLGISYRRVPLLAIGRDIYCDSQLIIEKLERLLPHGQLGSTKTYEQGIERIMQTWVIDGGPFRRTATLIPPDAGVMLDPKWTADREEMTGRPFNRQAMAAARADGLSHMKDNFGIIEHGLLADGRSYIFATEKPSLVDIHAIWPFDWAIGESMQMGEHLDSDAIAEFHLPRVSGCINRFREAVDAAQAANGPLPETLSSDDAINRILAATYWQKEGSVDELDPVKLKKGQMVQVYPTDTGANHRDRGRLVSLCDRTIVIESKVKDGDGHLRLHFPRHNFKVEPVTQES